MLKKSRWLILSSPFHPIQLRYSKVTQIYISVLAFWMRHPGETWLEALRGEVEEWLIFD